MTSSTNSSITNDAYKFISIQIMVTCRHVQANTEIGANIKGGQNDGKISAQLQEIVK